MSYEGKKLVALVDEAQGIGSARAGDVFEVVARSGNHLSILDKDGERWGADLREMGHIWELLVADELQERIQEQVDSADVQRLPTFAGNTKDDSEKLMGHTGVDEYFPRVMEELANLSQGGANKYAWNGWSDVEDGVRRYRNGEWRHRQAINKGEVWDEDISRYSPRPVRHQTSRIWNLCAALELELRAEENDELR